MQTAWQVVEGCVEVLRTPSSDIPRIIGSWGCVVLLSIAFVCIAPVRGQVTPQRLLDSAKEPQNWLTYSGDYAGRRFSELNQINTANAHSLAPKWAYQTMA